MPANKLSEGLSVAKGSATLFRCAVAAFTPGWREKADA